MSDHSNTSRIRLSGHWDHTGVVMQIESLSVLHHLASGLENLYRIDCSEIDSVDMTGLQLLHVWLQCVTLLGAQPELVNLPEGMRQTIKRLGLEKCFSEFTTDAALDPGWATCS